MIYSWKFDRLYPVDANVAGRELQRIYDARSGELDPKDVVEASRSEDAPLHCCFEWNDAVAAERYRINQASDLIRAIRVEVETSQGEQVEVRAFESVESTYHPIEVIRADTAKIDALRDSARRDYLALYHKYSTIAELQPIWDAIEEVEKIAG